MITRVAPATDAQDGVTLIELLVAMLVVAALTAIAWPGYGAIVHRANRNDARLALLRIQQLQERHYTLHLRFASGLGTVEDASTLAAADATDGGHYLLTLTGSEDGQRFTATATARRDGRQRGDDACQQLSVDETGQRRSADVAGRWREDDPGRCWN